MLKNSTDRRLLVLGVLSSLGIIALFAVPAMSEEVLADGKGDLQSVLETVTVMSNDSNKDCKGDIDKMPISLNCQFDQKLTVVVQSTTI